MSVQDALLSVRGRLQSLGSLGFVRSVGILAGGTALAQGISVLTLPFVTRLYTPDDFSVLAVFVSFLSILSISACLRLDVAIPLPKRDVDAANLLALSLCGCTVVSAVIAIAIWCVPLRIISSAGLSAQHQYLWLLPIGVWLTSTYSALQFWFTRTKKFDLIAKTRVTQAISGIGVQVGMGWFGIGPLGLLLGQVVSSGTGISSLLLKAIRDDDVFFRKITFKKMRHVLKRYSRFPKYATFEALANIAGIQLPIILIAALAGGPEPGYLMLATRAMTIPMGLIGGAIAQVYLSRAPEEFRTGSLEKFSEKVLAGLFKAGVGPLVAIGILAPAAFSIIFGKEWARSGELIAWMVPWFIFQFLSSPISMVMHVTNKQKEMLVVTLFGLIIRVGTVAAAAHWLDAYISEAYAISGGIFYLGCYFIFSRAAGVSVMASKGIVKVNLFPLIAWVAGAVICRIIFQIIG